MDAPSDTENTDLDVEDNFTIYFDGRRLGNVSEVNITIIFNLLQIYPPALLQFAGASCILFMIFGIPANAISIAALAKSKKLRNLTTPLVINLCVVDLLFCISNLPLHASNFLNRSWVLGHGLCMVFAMIRFVCVGLSLLTVMSIAFNRYVLIVHPSYYRKIFNKYVLVVIITLIWLISFLMLIPSMFGKWGTIGYDPQVGMCTILPDKSNSSQKISLFVSAFVFPSIVFAYCYVRIYWVVRKSQAKVKKMESKEISSNISSSVESGINRCQKRDVKSTWIKWFNSSGEKENSVSYVTRRMNKTMLLVRTILVIFCTFVICYLPQTIVKVLQKEKELPYVNILGYLVMDVTNCINPIIYVVMSKEYRQAYYELLNCNRSPSSSTTDSTHE